MKSKENLQKEQLYREFVQREENLIHAPYNPELEFYSCIREGNVEKIKQDWENFPKTSCSILNTTLPLQQHWQPVTA